MDELLNQNPVTPTPRTYFVCLTCQVLRPLGVEWLAENICVYCQQNAVDNMLELKWCIHGAHEAPRHVFARPDTRMEGVESKTRSLLYLYNPRRPFRRRLLQLSHRQQGHSLHSAPSNGCSEYAWPASICDCQPSCHSSISGVTEYKDCAEQAEGGEGGRPRAWW
jgi:hypothetical protein